MDGFSSQPISPATRTTAWAIIAFLVLPITIVFAVAVVGVLFVVVAGFWVGLVGTGVAGVCFVGSGVVGAGGSSPREAFPGFV